MKRLLLLLVIFLVACNHDVNLDEFAQCLSNEGFTLYSANTCPHCVQQEKMFGDSFKYIYRVECNPHAPNAKAELCIEKEIEGTPTWIREEEGKITKYQGTQPLVALSLASGCELPQSE
ncbi:hypothetical protein ACFL1B_02690 [Nanoarchaeota archaeon]